jgi:Putative metal-binding motif
VRAPPFAHASSRLPLLALRLGLSTLLILAGCAHSGIASDDDESASPATGDLDSSIVVRSLDAAAPRGDAAPSDGGCVGTSCQVFDCPDGQVPTVCGCGAADSDEDGTPDCADQCPNDRNKKLPGSCGCGSSDLDTDIDGVPDCSDKCSGKADGRYVPDTSCGVGYCRSRNRASTCVNGVETQCKAGEPLSGSDATCDGVDDDCDGTTDEDFGMRSSSCGKGACGRTGTVSCVAGRVVDSCVAGAAPANDDDTCDAVDDDCDGDIDEDYPVRASSCAAGACAATGTISCSDGKVVDSCSAKAPVSSDDSSCNNVDEDCDGKVDEDYRSTATSCGVGACSSTGSTSCSKGKVVNSCKPANRPSDNDTSCNNVDDDCNGKVDDGFVSRATQCGQGVCAASGTLTCVSGSTKDSCAAGAPNSGTDDAFLPGNGLDDDCDGSVDEDIPACDTAPRTYLAGSYDIAVPGNCRSLSVSLWGGGGGGGQAARSEGGAGGPGGFVTATALINGAIKLSVGGGGATGCGSPGGNTESSRYNGGWGGGGVGADGGDGSAPGGGNGGAPNYGQRGGTGHFGGGGGGGNGSSSATGGGGGAASVLTINGTRAAVAGGGGGGGGAQASFFGSSRGGAGGSGCGADGRAETSDGGGGGGGGLCIGDSTQTGSGTTPASSDRLPIGYARGGASSCNAGGPGYAIVTFSP